MDLEGCQQEILKGLLMDYYKEKNIVDDNNKGLPMCDKCEKASLCYKGAEERKPNIEEEEWSHIIRPWIGKSYGLGKHPKILVMSQNPNEAGGINLAEIWVEAVKKEFAKGKAKVNFGYIYEDGEKYVGTILFHRIAAYAKALLFACSVLEGDRSRKDVENNMKLDYSPQQMLYVFDEIAFLNQIKCSPLGQRSDPTLAMWNHCGNHILKGEIELLRPDYILILGKRNGWYFRDKICGQRIDKYEEKKDISCFTTNVFGKVIRILILPHPAAPGGNKVSYYNELIEAALNLG